MKAIAIAWWDERNAREKRFLSIGLLIVGLTIFYNVLIQPALSGSASIRAALPAMRQQLAAMEDQGNDARRLSAAAQSVAPTGDSLSSAVTSSLADKGLTADKVELAGAAVRVDLKHVSFARTVGWLDDMRKQLKVQVSEAHIAPAAEADGRVDVSVTVAAANGRAGP